MTGDDTTINVYEAVGGEETFYRLVDIFYDRLERDPLLRSLFPEDLAPGKRYQAQFLIQYWGGPTLYAEQRGHPRLRMRHSTFAVTPLTAALWRDHMLASIDEVGIAEPARSLMREYFTQGAVFLINHADDDPAS